jgi:uncharacterized delta-60 repeat protein
MTSRIISSVILLTLALAPLVTFAASGDFDRSYGTNGVTTAGLGPVDTLAIQPDNKVIAGGPFGDQFYLSRFLTSGAADPSFGFSGHVYTPILAGSTSSVEKVLVLPGGKILAVGFTDYYNPVPSDHDFYQVAVARYNPNGTLDTTFDADGIFTNAIMAGRGARGYDAVVQPDGKIIVVGVGSLASQSFVVLRLNDNGSFDTSFGGGDWIYTADGGGSGGAHSVALQSNGKVVVGGVGSIGSKMVVIRATADGNTDVSFANSGRLVFSGEFTFDWNRLNRVIVLPDDKIFIGGTSQRPNGNQVSLNRLNPDGSFDPSFDGNGQMITLLGQDAERCDASDFLVQPDGKIVLAATCIYDAHPVAAVSARIMPNGALDQQFGDHGAIARPATYSSGAVVAQSDGKLIFSGLSLISYPDNLPPFLARQLANGTRDADFDNDRRADISVFRPSTGSWYINNSTTGFSAVQFGANGDRIVPGDYDGDGRIDVAVFRNGDWYQLRSSDGSFYAAAFGQAGDIPVAADYDGDGKADLAVFRQGTWYILNSHDGSFRAEQFGQTGDRPVVGNFDGDLRSDLAVFRGGFWYVSGSSSGFTYTRFGLDSDRPVAADYDSDGQTDYAVYRDGTWYELRSFAGFAAVQFGRATDQPAPADYDGDGIADLGVFRDGAWYTMGSTAGNQSTRFGQAGDVPVPSAFLPQ